MDERSRRLRLLIIDALSHGQGHVGPALSLVEILRVLFDDYLRFDPGRPAWDERDRLILSKGHGCLALYAILADAGFFDPEELRTFGQSGSRLGGHPERGLLPGVEASTGSLGHGLPIGVGLALAGRMRGRGYRVVVVTGDGELNEGSNWEAALHASKHALDGLTLFVDHNKQQCHGPSEDVVDLRPLGEKLQAFGFETHEVDGHSVEELRRCVQRLPFAAGRPSAVICHTVKGYGLERAEHSPAWHYQTEITKEVAAELRSALAKGLVGGH